LRLDAKVFSLITARFASISALAALPPQSIVNLSHSHSVLAPTLSTDIASGFSKLNPVIPVLYEYKG